MLSSQAHVLSTGDLTAGYRPAVAGFDELMTASGAIKAQWLPFLEELAALDPATRSARMENLNTRVRETGIAYDLFSDPASTVQPWRVDLMPLIFSTEEWRELERGLIQRARLFEAMLADIYGSQRLLATGAIPHQLVFSDPAYLRPCQHLKPAGGYIQFFAADLARGPDGRWRVIDTHTETPAGIGYALANRMVHTNVAGDLFGACRAQRLAPFFQQMQTALARRANRPDPSIALLTPGPLAQRFLQSCLSRPLPRPAVGGGRRLARGRRPRLAEDARRPDVDRPDRALHRRCGRRSARIGFVGLCRPGGAAAGGARAVRPGGQRAGLGAGRGNRGPGSICLD